MCTVLSLAIRAFLALLAAILASTSLPTRAQELQFDLTGQALTQNTNVPVGPFDISFVLDTQSGTRSLIFGTFNNPGAACLGRFNVNDALLTNVTILVAGQSMFSGNTTGAYGGDNPSPVCPGDFLADRAARAHGGACLPTRHALRTPDAREASAAARSARRGSHAASPRHARG